MPSLHEKLQLSRAKYERDLTRFGISLVKIRPWNIFSVLKVFKELIAELYMFHFDYNSTTEELAKAINDLYENQMQLMQEIEELKKGREE